MAEPVPKSEWWHQYVDFMLPGYKDYVETETYATGLQIFCAAVVPGLLQTERYARKVIKQVASHTLSSEWVAKLLQATVLAIEVSHAPAAKLRLFAM